MLKDFLQSRATAERPLTEDDFIRLIHDIQPIESCFDGDCPAEAMWAIASQGLKVFPISDPLIAMFMVKNHDATCNSSSIHDVAQKYLQGRELKPSIVDFTSVKEQALTLVLDCIKAEKEQDERNEEFLVRTGYYIRVAQDSKK